MDPVGEFSNGQACVEVGRSPDSDDKSGFTVKLSNFVIKARFDQAYDFSDGFAPVKLDGKWGFINPSTCPCARIGPTGPWSTLMKTFSAVITEEDGGYVSLCTELDIASQGDSIEEAIANLKEAVEGFFETASPEEIRQRLKKPSLFTHIEIACA